MLVHGFNKGSVQTHSTSPCMMPAFGPVDSSCSFIFALCKSSPINERNYVNS